MIKFGNPGDAWRQPRTQPRTLKNLILHTLPLLTELRDVGVVPPPLPAEGSFDHGSPWFQLQHCGDHPNVFSNPGPFGDPQIEFEISTRNTMTNLRSETCSTCGKLGHRSRNRNCESYKATHFDLTAAASLLACYKVTEGSKTSPLFAASTVHRSTPLVRQG